ncbi:protein enabled-like, partial [Lucilia sericata]|uniref:protein enabled-like n=1 Tax=Lucilia sericata TaxID=13632 RepID=UPI0018A82815
MKKLYAKTSFSSKSRATKSNHKADNETLTTSSSSQAEIYKYHDPILAYQTTTTATTPTTTPNKTKEATMKYTPKHPFVSKFHNLEPQYRTNQNELTANGMSMDKHPVAAASAAATLYNDESPYYYTITELENLHMLDHRHPQFHHLQRMQQLQHNNNNNYNNNSNNKVQYHQYNQLVLQLPPASSVTSNRHDNDDDDADDHDDVVDGLQHQQRLISPIYEAPQMNSHQHYNHQQYHNYNQHNHNNASLSANMSATSKSSISSTTPPPPPPHHSISTHCATTTLSSSTLSASTSPLDVYNLNCNLYDQNQPQLSSLMSSPSSSVSLSSISTSSSSSLSTPRDNLSSKMDFMTTTNSTSSTTIISPTLFAEQSIIGARASVMVYDDNQKKWVPSGTSSGLSKVQIYHHQQNNTFRVVGRKLQDHEVVINCSILKGLKYNQATATFHQWRDSKYVYGLNFSSQNDAEAFARAMMHALDVLSGRVPNNPGQPTNGNSYEEDMGYRTMTSEDAAILRQQQQITGQVTPSAQTPTSQTNQNNIPQSPPTPQQGHHRTSSAPPAPQPQQQMLQQQQQQQQQALYGHTGNGPTQNGGMQQQQQQPTQQMQQPPPAPGQTQYHAPQQLQQQQQPQQPSQHQQQQQHSIYASQQMVNAAGYPPQPNQ